MWLTAKLAPDFKTIADFRRDNGEAIKAVCRQFVSLCRGLGLLNAPVVAVDGSRFKAVNSRDRNFTPTKLAKRLERLDASIERYLAELDEADREDSDGPPERVEQLGETIARLRAWMQALKSDWRQA